MSNFQNDFELTIARSYKLLKVAGWMFLALVVIFLVITPVAYGWLLRAAEYRGPVVSLMQPIEQVQSVLIHLLAMGWIFFLGGCLASFLNVVAWRVPRGRKITGSSRCGLCHQKLAFLQNIPVTGWLRSSGHCTHCGASISVRYLLAEIVLGTTFLLLGSVVFLTGAANWPIETPVQPAGFQHLLFSLNWDVICVLLWHLTLICFLFTFMLIESEGFSIPASIIASGIFIVCIVAMLRPEVWLVSWRQPTFLWESGPITGGDWIMILLLGGGMGFLIGHVVQWATSIKTAQPSALVAGLALVGMFLGWQAVFAVATFTLAGWACLRGLFRHSSTGISMSPSVCLLLATVIHLLVWGNLCFLRDVPFL